MRMLFVSLIVVLFISGKLATPIEPTDVIEASGETENLNKNEDAPSEDKSSVEQLNNENEMPTEVIEETVKRSKKSNYPSAPNPSAPYPSAPYPSAPYPSAPYPSAPYPSAPHPSAPYISLCPCSYSQGYAQPSVAYNQQQISYGQPSYGGYSAPGPKQRRKGRSHSKNYQGNQLGQPPQQSYQPSYQPQQPSYQPQQPSYQSPQPSYQPPQPSYQPPQPSYQPPHTSYQPTSAPAYSAPSQSYSYSSRGPNVQCGSNMLVGCHPHVSQVPCSGYSPSYGNPGYAPQQYSTPAYRSNAEEDQSVSSPIIMTNPNNNEMNSYKNASANPLKDDSATPVLSVDDTEKPTNNDNNGKTSPQKDTVSAANQQELSPEEALKKYETLLKMTKLAKELTKDDKANPQPNQLPTSNTIKTSENPSVPAATLPGPQPTSMNMGMNQTPSNQQHGPFFSQPQQQQMHQQHQQQPQMRWAN